MASSTALASTVSAAAIEAIAKSASDASETWHGRLAHPPAAASGNGLRMGETPMPRLARIIVSPVPIEPTAEFGLLFLLRGLCGRHGGFSRRGVFLRSEERRVGQEGSGWRAPEAHEGRCIRERVARQQ